MRRRSTAIDTHDFGELRGVALRTRVVRLALAVATLAALAAAVVEARSLGAERRTIVPSGSTAVVVIDLSLSIAEGHYQDVRRALRSVVAANAPVGLVVFSDVPYELLPPGTPARELRPILGVLAPPRRGSTLTPWTQTFRAGTRISQALELARTMLERERVARGSIVLVSDLQTAPDDLAALTRTIEALRARSVDVRLVPIGALSDGRLLFGRLLGPEAFVEPGQLGGETIQPVRSEHFTTLPLALVALALGVFLAVAAHERLGVRLALGSRGRRTA
jgi:hypothetical protein